MLNIQLFMWLTRCMFCNKFLPFKGIFLNYMFSLSKSKQNDKTMLKLTIFGHSYFSDGNE